MDMGCRVEPRSQGTVINSHTRQAGRQMIVCGLWIRIQGRLARDLCTVSADIVHPNWPNSDRLCVDHMRLGNRISNAATNVLIKDLLTYSVYTSSHRPETLF